MALHDMAGEGAEALRASFRAPRAPNASQRCHTKNGTPEKKSALRGKKRKNDKNLPNYHPEKNFSPAAGYAVAT